MSKLIIVLIGLPCSGKSTYLTTIDYDFVISSDAIVEILCKQSGIAYHDYFKLSSDSKLKQMHKTIFDNLIEESKAFDRVVWDLTNLTRESRARIFKHYPNAQFSAVVFDRNEDASSLREQNKQRFLETGKYIDENVLQAMFDKYEEVSEQEAFDDVQLFTNIQQQSQ